MDKKLKNLLKKILGKKIYIFFSNLLFKDFEPYKISSLINPYRQYSDFFIYSTDCFSINFIAENLYALHKKEPFEINHIFRFYDADGKFIKKFIYGNNAYICNIELPKIILNNQYISFTHETLSKNKNNKLDKVLEKKIIGLNHRGYAIYKLKEDSLGSIVHGNFGGINPSQIYKSAAKQSLKEFKYTPAFLFCKSDKYHCVFNNPTKKTLTIKINLDNIQKTKKGIKSLIKIKPFGSDFFEIQNYSGKISFISKLPIGRPLVFKNKNSINKNFDVFHS